MSGRFLLDSNIVISSSVMGLVAFVAGRGIGLFVPGLGREVS